MGHFLVTNMYFVTVQTLNKHIHYIEKIELFIIYVCVQYIWIYHIYYS